VKILNNKKVGFVSLIGRPSSGKSTLVNVLCGYKISIVSKHPQTTRNLIKGIYNDDESQIIFIDTPGYHIHKSILNKNLSKLALRTIDDGDLILYLVDSTRSFGEEEKKIAYNVKEFQNKLIIIYNKIDDEKSNIPAIKKEIENIVTPLNYIEISALKKTNIYELLKIIKQNLIFGELYFPEDYVTDQNIPFRISEVVREKIFNMTDEEIPHSTYVEIESLDVKDEKITAHCIIYVEKDTQKGIIIGRSGSMIKKIGISARKDLKDIFEKDVDIFLKVKVNHNWRKKEQFIKKMYELD
jgi:GTPase